MGGAKQGRGLDKGILLASLFCRKDDVSNIN